MATVAAGRRLVDETQRPIVWLAVLTLATLRSPFLPQPYAAFPPLWLLTLLVATLAPRARTLAALMLAWLSLYMLWPLDWGMDPRALALLTLVPQTVTVVLAVLGLRRAFRHGRLESPEGQGGRLAADPGIAVPRVPPGT